MLAIGDSIILIGEMLSILVISVQDYAPAALPPASHLLWVFSKNWAHNSHLGDAPATELGGKGYFPDRHDLQLS
jgi:hypothetical protein